MGAWGAGIFENDDAADWTYDLEETQNISFVVETLETITTSGNDYAEAPDCCNALAAAEVIAVLMYKGSPNLPDRVKQWVSLQEYAVERSNVELALKAIQRIRTKSELKDLWDESEYKEEWYAVLDDLEQRPNQAAS